MPELKAHLRQLLSENQAHIGLADVLSGFPLERINERGPGLPYSAWDILWHLWFAQRDILEFMGNGAYTPREWPQEYWPRSAGTPESWAETAQMWQSDLQRVLEILERAKLLDVVPHGRDEGGSQTYLRELLLIADHNAYHVGQLALIKRLLQA